MRELCSRINRDPLLEGLSAKVISNSALTSSQKLAILNFSLNLLSTYVWAFWKDNDHN
jgi:hypothetical protein